MKLHVFTIVLDGMPWLPCVYTTLQKVRFDWVWHVSQGVALPKHCTSWCKKIEPRLGNDGTPEFLELISSDERVVVHSKNEWNGKIEMINADVNSIRDGDIVIQIDSDEIWSPETIENAVYFLSRSEYGGLACPCRYFITPNRVLTTPGTHGNHTEYEWRRMWKGYGGFRFRRHEPPEINRDIKYMPWHICAKLGITFDHYAYVTPAQVMFKEEYYGYKGALKEWQTLCSVKDCNVDVSKYLSWIKEKSVGTLLK